MLDLTTGDTTVATQLPRPQESDPVRHLRMNGTAVSGSTGSGLTRGEIVSPPWAEPLAGSAHGPFNRSKINGI